MAKIFVIPRDWSGGPGKIETFGIIWDGLTVELPFPGDLGISAESRRPAGTSRLLWARGKEIYPEKGGGLRRGAWDVTGTSLQGPRGYLGQELV